MLNRYTKLFSNSKQILFVFLTPFHLYVLIVKLIIIFKCPFVFLSVRQPHIWGNVIFSTHNWDRAPFFSVPIPLIYEHIFLKYFVRWPVGQATKGRIVKKYRKANFSASNQDSSNFSCTHSSYIWASNL